MTFRYFLTALLLLAIGWWMASSCQEPKPPEKEVSKSEEVHYLNPNQCASCHKEIVDSYLKTGKGRSFYPASIDKSFEDWTVSPVHDAIRDFFYLPYQTGNGFYIKEYRLEKGDTIHQRTERIDFFIGSGNQTRSYLYKKNGYLYEMPLTWYTKKQIWDLSPGYENGANNRFEREVGEECMACHNSGFDAKPHSVNRYRTFGNALSCESCHGNLGTHMETMKSGKAAGKDPSVLKLGKLPVQAQMDVCRNCHLEGVKVRKEKARKGDFEPGKLFSDYYEVFIPATGEQDFGFASHAERLQLSACFLGSKGTMTCVTCHNPHESLPENPKVVFNNKCRSCHEGEGHKKSCSGLKNMDITEEAASNCISCHLQKSGTNDIPHVSSTDHWIRKNPLKTKEKGQSIRFRNFAGAQFTNRDKGNALLQYAEAHSDTSSLKEVARYVQYLTAEQRLKYAYISGDAVWNWGDTVRLATPPGPWALFYLAELKKKQGLPFRSQLEEACRMAPDMVAFQYRKAQSDEETMDPEMAYAPVLKLQPEHARSLSNLGFRFVQMHDYKKAEGLLIRALRQEPDFTLAQENLARCYLEQGKFAECRKVLNRLIRQFPNENRYLQALNSIP